MIFIELMQFGAVKRFILDLLFPKQCLGCGYEGVLLCPKCEMSMQMIPPACFVCKKMAPPSARLAPGRTCPSCRRESSIHTFLSPFLYDHELIRELIHMLKYYRVQELSAVLGRNLSSYVRYFGIALPEDCMIIPVPLHPRRKRVRGFNQAELIAQGFLASLSGKDFKIENGLLKRVRKTRPQVELSGEERRKNVQGIFSVKRPEEVKGKSILLLDDVKTTGATLEEAARVLKEAGAKEVWAMTVAH